MSLWMKMWLLAFWPAGRRMSEKDGRERWRDVVMNCPAWKEHILDTEKRNEVIISVLTCGLQSRHKKRTHTHTHTPSTWCLVAIFLLYTPRQQLCPASVQTITNLCLLVSPTLFRMSGLLPFCHVLLQKESTAISPLLAWQLYSLVPIPFPDPLLFNFCPLHPSAPIFPTVSCNHLHWTMITPLLCHPPSPTFDQEDHASWGSRAEKLPVIKGRFFMRL